MKIIQLNLYDKNFFILFDETPPPLNGNKAWKMQYLMDDNNLLKALKSASPQNNTIISYGSNQSNALYSLAYFCKQKNIEFFYVTNYCPRVIYENSNLDLSLKSGAKIIYSHPQNYEQMAKNIAKNSNYFLIKEGVCEDFAEFGFESLGNFINDNFKDLDADIFLPSGTGTSAAFLQKYVKYHDIFTTPCYKDKDFLQKNINALNPHNKIKIILPKHSFVFGSCDFKLYEEIMKINEKCEIDFELIYDSIGFLAIKNNLKNMKKNIIYIHQGGQIGHVSQLKRYEEKRMKNGLFNR